MNFSTLRPPMNFCLLYIPTSPPSEKHRLFTFLLPPFQTSDMSDSQVAESSRTASVRETLIDLRATKLATTNGVKSQTTTTTSVSVPQSSQKTAVSGFDGEDFVRFSDVDLSTDMPHEEPFAPPAAVAGKKRSAHDMENGYLNKKQETDANSRHCPWALHVDWQSCTNPAQMYDLLS